MEGHVLLKGPAMHCTSVGNGIGNRTAAWCVSPVGGDVSCGWLGATLGSLLAGA